MSLKLGVPPATNVMEDRVISLINQSYRVKVTDKAGSFCLFKRDFVDLRPDYFPLMAVGDVIECFEDEAEDAKPPTYVKIQVEEPDKKGMPFSYAIVGVQ